MVNFWDLPRPVRDKIYRLNLVHEGIVDLDAFKAACGLEEVVHSTHRSTSRGKPYLFHFGTRPEREAAGIFFGENTFFLTAPHEVYLWKSMIWPRHFKLIRKVSVSGWNMPYFYGLGYNDMFKILGTMKSLTTLTLNVDEQESLELLLGRHARIKWHKSLGLSPQLHLQVLNFCGVNALLLLRNIQCIDFPPLTPSATGSYAGNTSGSDYHVDRGDIIGGFLDTTLRYEIAKPADKRT